MLARTPTSKPRFVPGGQRGRQASGPVSAARLVPFDYAARFELEGTPGNVETDVINVQPDAVFVATAISYGFEADRSRSLALHGRATRVVPAALRLGHVPTLALVEGFRVDPRSENMFFHGGGQPPRGARVDRPLSPEVLTRALADKLLERFVPDRELAFLFSMIDSSSGRELQDEPTHSLASLGRSDGHRPFRPLAPPVSFLPRSTLRLQVVERTADVAGTLHVVLSGYQLLVGREPPGPGLRASQAPAGVAGGAGGRTVPFDYVARLSLTGRPGNTVDGEVTVDADGSFVATAIGYGLDPAAVRAAPRIDPAQSSVNLKKVALSQFSSEALCQGLRVRPSHVRFLFSGASLVTSLPRDVALEGFEVMNRPEDVSFRYGFLDTASGRSWQNQPIHNIAGLGIADGMRPFKRLARPISFGPRTTFRVTVEEGSGRGELYFALHGFKVLEGARGGRS